MKALILAAGLGSRLKYKTTDRPKALTLINGKPIMEYQIQCLLDNGIMDINIVIGYKGEMIKRFIKDRFPEIRCTFAENKIYDQSNSSYSFWVARDLVKAQTYIHLNCDVIFSNKLLADIIKAPHDNVLAVRRDLELGDRMENVVLDGNNKIVRMTIDYTTESVGKAFGVAKLSARSSACVIRRLSRYIEKGDNNQNYYGIIREAVHELSYYAMLSDQKNLLEVNTLEDLAIAERCISHSTWFSSMRMEQK